MKIYTPIKIGKMEIKNRMVMSPMNTNLSDENGSVTETMIEYYEKRAKGGVGLITVEAASIVPDIINHGVQPLLDNEKYIPAWTRLVERIKRYGAKTSIEIVHYGSEGTIGPKVSASDVSSQNVQVKSLSIEEIKVIISQFVRSVKFAEMAGFDAVTLHAAHGYLLAQFLSPLYNKRKDRYGGSLENRARLLLEIIEGCREAVGAGFPIIVRYSCNEFILNGRGLDESKELAKILEKAGVDALDLSAGIPSSYMFGMPPHGMPGMYGFLLPLMSEIKKEISIPVICVGGIRAPEQAERIIERGDADIVALGRTLIADPEFCNKAVEGRTDDIRKCLSCQYCLEMLDYGRGLRCAVNAEAGREFESSRYLSAIKKKVLIVGAGPAGLEAARIAAVSGHKVMLCEKTDKMGGTLKAGMKPPQKEKIGELVDWYKKQLENLKVRVKLNTEYSRKLAEAYKPDVIIFAYGAVYSKRLAGSDNNNVLTAVEALIDPDKVGKNVLIIGGGSTGCETAEFLSEDDIDISFNGVRNFEGELDYTVKGSSGEKKREVSLIELTDEICSDMDKFNRPLMRIKLKEKGVNIFTNTMVERIKENEVFTVNTQDSQKHGFKADTIILSAGLENFSLETLALDKIKEYRIGDCNKPGKIADAIRDGYFTAKIL